MDNRLNIKEHFNNIANSYDYWKTKNWYYYQHLKNFYQHHIPTNKKVLELGCGTAEILNCVQPSYGVGIDVSKEMIAIASKKFPHLKFIAGFAESRDILKDRFEYVIMCDLLDHLTDVWELFRNMEDFVQENSKVIITTVNPAWSPIFNILEKLKLKMPEGPHNFLSRSDIACLLKLFSYEIETEGLSLLFPTYMPLVSVLMNRFIAKIPLIKNFCLVQYVVARKIKTAALREDLSCSVIVPCYNEAENVAKCLRRIPPMGRFTEIIFVDDGSNDSTADRVKELMNKDTRVKLVSYAPNKGKAQAIRTGFNEAKGDVVIILDADMSVMPEDLIKFFWAMTIPGVGFANGTRMIYPIEEQAMRWFNFWGNKIFSLIFTWLLGQRITDTLCGTKAILNDAYKKIHITSYDRWGDFDLLLGAAKLGLHIVEIPVRYKRRLRGESKMRPFKHCFQLLLRCLIGFRELKLLRLSSIFKRENAKDRKTF